MNIPDKIVHLIAEDDLPALQSWVEGEGSLGARDNNGETLLHKAAYRGAAKTAGWLISRGLDVNVRDNSGYAPLHEAARANRIEVMPLLLGHGADIYARTSGKKTPLDMAEEKGGYEAIRLLREVARRPRWIRTGEDEVAHVAHKDGVRYKITQIFNFATRSYLVIAQNEETNAEAVEQKSFSDFSDGHLIRAAEEAFRKMGGVLPADYGFIALEKSAARGLGRSAFGGGPAGKAP